MRKLIVFSTVMAFVFLSGSMGFAADKAPQELVDLAKTEMVKLGNDPAIVKAVKAHNTEDMTIAQIKEMDEKWEDAKETDGIVKDVITNDCAKHLKKLITSNPALEDGEEMYVLDKQGVLVASIKYEESYFWGEEKGFTEALNGNVHVSDFMIDEDENEYMVHVTIPVKENGQVIGAIDIGFEVDD